MSCDHRPFFHLWEKRAVSVLISDSTDFSRAMSSDPLESLSYSVNLRESTVLSEDVTKAVNETLNKFYFEAHYEDYCNFYTQHKNLYGAEKNFAIMQSEKVILCEINAGLWVNAIKSAINTLTRQTYPHYIIVQEFINYLLNADTDENFGLLESFFWQLLIIHPPTPEMFDYYSQIMLSHFVVMNNKRIEEHNLLVFLMELCLNDLQNVINSTDPSFVNGNIYSNSEYTKQDRMEAIKNLSVMEDINPTGNIKSRKIYLEDVPWSMRIKRCFVALNFAYDILEANFVFWLDSKNWKPFTVPKGCKKEPRLLLSQILWPDTRDIGLINNDVHRVLDLYKLIINSNLSYQYKNTIEKYAILIGETIRCSDSIEGIKYPFVGTKSDNFFRELSAILYKVLKECQTANFAEDGLLVNFKPPWLRLFLCSKLLSSITGSQCLPELTTAHDILMQIIHDECRNKETRKTQKNSRKSKDSRTIQKLKKLKNVNAKLASGKTHLHIACEENDIEKIKALLTLPELDVNVTDREGWTALHSAACSGNLDIVKELLSFSPKWENLQKSVNTRARGPQSITPIMCAALKNHADVCETLLEHSGSILLEDINEFNQTALELSNTPEVSKILEYYKNKNVSTFHTHKDMCFNSDVKQLVLRLCTEMIQAYFCTHRTWDVYRSLKKCENSSEEALIFDLDDKWDYMRYHRDIKRNILKLRILVPKLEKLEEFKSVLEVYIRLLSFNKVCQYYNLEEDKTEQTKEKESI